jgi:hypothetical protein
MGRLSVWHFLTASSLLFVVVIIAIVTVALYFILHKSPNGQDTGASASGDNAAPAGSPLAVRSTAQKVIAVAYLVGGIFGVITLLPQLNGVSLSVMSALAWLILSGQIAAALYGGWQFWHHRALGAQLLYWLSWSCAPVISFSALSYWCAMGLALFPTVTLGAGTFGTDVSLRFGYASELWFNTGNAGAILGVNVVALLFVGLLTKLMREAGIAKWPLLKPTA